MKRILGFIVIALVCVFYAHSSATWIIRDKTYNVDTLSHTYVGPGTTHTALSLTGGSTLKIFYTTTDLSNPYVDVRVIKGNDKVVGVETVSSMITSRSKNGVKYFSGVNADFFGNSAPIGTTMVDGEIYNINNGGGWQAFGLNQERIPFLGVPMVNSTIVSANAGSMNINAFNTARYENYLVLYSKRKGSASGTNVYGSEIALMPVDANAFPQVGKTMKMKVVSAPVNNVGDMAIPTGGFVLSGNGNAAEYIKKLVVDEIIEINSSVSFDSKDAGNITQIVGGQPMIVSNGVVLDTEGAIDHLVGLHPRTAVGFTADKKKLVMLVVDGRSTASAGVVSKALADIMINIGCSEAMNFDGGGSTELYIDKLGIINDPSDGRERSVTNGLFLASSTPEDNVISQIRFTDQSKSLPKYGYYTPKFYGYNQYGMLLSTNVEGVTLTADKELGDIQNDGRTLFCNGEGSHALVATYNGATTTMPVTVVTGDVSFKLASAIEDTYQGYKVEVESTVNGETMPLDNQALNWWSDDTSIATVEPYTGIVKGLVNGTTKVHGSVDGFTGTLDIIVEKPLSNVAPIDPDMDVATWTISQSGGKNITAVPVENGMKFTYTGSSSRAPYIKLAKKIRLWSLPDIIRLRINPGNATFKKISYVLNNALTGNVNTSIDNLNLKPNEINVIDLPTTQWCDGSRGNFPITLSVMNMEMGVSTTGTEYTVEIPGIEVVYLNAPSGVNSPVSSEKQLNLYPNPIKAGEPLFIEIPGVNRAKISIYGMDGSLCANSTVEVSNNIAQVTTKNLTIGNYLLKVESDGISQTLKLIIK